MGTIIQQPFFRAVHRRDLERALRSLRRDLGMSRSDLAVITSLLSFLPCFDRGQERPIAPDLLLTIFASNAALCDRAGGIDDRTVRRSLSRLEERAWIIRRDSANGKRFARKSKGKIVAAFGIDITPLLCQAHELIERAETKAQAEDEKRGLIAEAKAIRIACLERLADRPAPPFLNDLSKVLRRNLSLPEIKMILAELDALYAEMTSTQIIRTFDADSHTHATSKIAHGQGTETARVNETGDGRTDTNTNIVPEVHSPSVLSSSRTQASSPAEGFNAQGSRASSQTDKSLSHTRLKLTVDTKQELPANPRVRCPEVHQKANEPTGYPTGKSPATDGQNARHKETQKSKLKNLHRHEEISLHETWMNCSELQSFFPGNVQTEHQGKRVLFDVSRMLRIKDELVSIAVQKVGLHRCLVLVDHIVTKVAMITAPEAYLRKMLNLGHAQT